MLVIEFRVLELELVLVLVTFFPVSFREILLRPYERISVKKKIMLFWVNF